MKNKLDFKSILFILSLILLILFILLYIYQSKITIALIEKEIASSDDNEYQGSGLEPEYDFKSVEEITLENYMKHKQEFSKTKSDSTIDIYDVNIHLPIFKGLNQVHLIKGAGEQLPEDEMQPGNYGNYILVAHRMPYSSKLGFARLANIKNGNKIVITKNNKKYTYSVISKVYTNNNDTKYLNNYQNRKILTLYTCQNFSRHGENPNKIVVQAELVENDEN